MPITKTYYKVHRCFPDPDYFYMENISGNTATFGVFKSGTPASTDLAYSFDKVTWTDIHNGGNIYNVANGAKVYFRSSTGFSSGNYNSYTLKATNSPSSVGTAFNVGGHIATLINYLNVNSITDIPSGAFACMFCYNTNYGAGLVHANIDFYGIKSILSNGCHYMFGKQANLINVPDLSGIETIDSGCENMFVACTSLVSPADFSGVTTILGSTPFYNLYNGCSSLTEAIVPNVSTWNVNHFSGWLSNVAPTGVVRKPAGLTIPTDSASGVPTGWTTEDY